MDKGDVIFRALQTLGGIGGGIAADRANRRADKETTRRQSVANLINTLRGRQTASVTPETPTLGVGGRLLQGLSSLGAGGGALRQQGRAVTQQELENTRAEDAAAEQTRQFGIEAAQGQQQIDINRWNAAIKKANSITGGPKPPSLSSVMGAGDGVGAAGRGAGEEYHKTREKTVKDAVVLFQGGGIKDENLIAQYAGAVGSGWDKADDRWRGRYLQDRGLQQGADRITQVDRRLDWREEQALNKEYVETANGLAVRIGKEIRASLTVPGYVTEFKGPAEIIAETNEMASEVKGGQEALTEMSLRRAKDVTLAAHADAIAAVNADLSEQGPDATVKYHLAQKQALLLKLKYYEEGVLGQADATGPWWGRIPAFQYILPDDAVAEDFIEGFALEIASVLNDGRPSEQDKNAARAMVPDRQDTAEVAAGKMRNMIALAEITIRAVKNEFPAPMMVYVNKEGEFDLQRAEDQVMGGTLDAEQIRVLKHRANEGDQSAAQLLSLHNLSDESTGEKGNLRVENLILPGKAQGAQSITPDTGGGTTRLKNTGSGFQPESNIYEIE